PVSVQDREGTLSGAIEGGPRARRPDDPHAGDGAELERAIRTRSREDRYVVFRRHPAGPDVPLAADARISAALRAADVSLFRKQRATVGGVVLLARGLHAPLCAIRRRVRQLRGDAGPRARY